MGFGQIDMDIEAEVVEDVDDMPPPSDDPTIQWLALKIISIERDVKGLKRGLGNVEREVKILGKNVKGLMDEGDPWTGDLQRYLQGIYTWYFMDKSLKSN